MLRNETSLTQLDLINSLVFFGAPSWCLPCQRLLPVIENISEEFDNAQFIHINVDEADELVREYKISSVPTVKIFVNGEEKESLYGLLPKTTYIDKLNLYFGD